MNIQRLFESKKVVYSLEVFPPKKTTSIETIYNTLYGLRGLKPDFISVTYGAGGSTTQKNKTCEIASLIKSEYQIEPVSHLTCVGSTKQDIIEYLDRLKAEGVQNILALRGDITPENDVIDFKYASDLVEFIKKYDDSFNISGACYPEGHCDAANIDEDIENLKKKVDAGVTHLVTQLFFDNDNFYRFMDKIEKKDTELAFQLGGTTVFDGLPFQSAIDYIDWYCDTYLGIDIYKGNMKIYNVDLSLKSTKVKVNGEKYKQYKDKSCGIVAKGVDEEVLAKDNIRQLDRRIYNFYQAATEINSSYSELVSVGASDSNTYTFVSTPLVIWYEGGMETRMCNTFENQIELDSNGKSFLNTLFETITLGNASLPDNE